MVEEEILQGVLCKEDDDCEDICEDVYDPEEDDQNFGKVETCLELPYDTVREFRYIMNFLEDPYASDLRNINGRVFSKLLDISVEPWVRSTVSREVNTSEAATLLIWVARETDISTAIVDAYRNREREFNLYEGVANLFEEIESINDPGCSGRDQRCAEMFNAIAKVAIQGDQFSFWNIANDPVSASAVHIACAIFNQRCDSTAPSSSCDVNFTEYDNFYNYCNPQ